MDMHTLYTITGIAFFIWTIRNIFFWVNLWQLKEYRLDILSVHLRETVQGRSLYTSLGNISKWIILLLYPVIVFQDQYTFWYELLIAAVFVIEAFIVLKEIAYHQIKRPIPTVKALILIVFSVIAISFLVMSPLVNEFVWFLLLDRIAFIVVSFFVFFLSFPTEIHRDLKIQRAMKKIKEYKNLLVIAVSGSYGKTSTKEYIAQVLSAKYHVVKTPGSNNTPIAIANTILNNIKEDTEIFVVEVGAVKRGEVAEIAAIVSPKISITTAVSDQHISLYGNLENVITSECELINALPKDGLALFNANGGFTDKVYEQTKVKKIYYKRYAEKPTKNGVIAAYNIKTSPDGISFTVGVNHKEINLTAPLLGTHAVENILPAVFLGITKGLTAGELQKAVSNLKPPAQTMVRKPLLNEIIGIDDTFNASPESVFAAMDYIKLYKRKKYFVLAPLIELGKESKKRHYQIGLMASKSCTHLYLLNKNYFKEVIEGVRAGKGKCQVHVVSQKIAAEEIKSTAKSGDVVLFEGKEAKVVMKKLL